MKTKIFAFFAVLWLSVLAAPSCFALPDFVSQTLAFFYTKPGKPYVFNKTKIALPLKKSSKSVVCVNRNYYDTQKFGNALCSALDEYSFDCMVKLAEFIPKETVVGYDYVWTFQVTSWKDKNVDDVPEKVKALVLLYDRDYNLLLKSNVQIRKSKDPQAPNCLEFLTQEYVNSLFNEVVEAPKSAEKTAVKTSASDGSDESAAKEKPAKKKGGLFGLFGKKDKKNSEKQADEEQAE